MGGGERGSVLCGDGNVLSFNTDLFSQLDQKISDGRRGSGDGGRGEFTVREWKRVVL